MLWTDSDAPLQGLKTLATGLVVLYIAHLISSAVYNLYFHPLAKYPGPRLRAASYAPEILSWWSARHVHIVKELHDRYGEVVRLAPDRLSFSHSTANKEIYGFTKGKSQIPKDLRFYMSDNPRAPRSLINADDEGHSRIRRLVSHAFSAKALQEQEDILSIYFDMLIARLIRSIDDPSLRGRVDMTRLFNYLTWDIVGDLALGSPFGMLAGDQPHAFMERVTRGSNTLVVSQTGHYVPPVGLLLKLYAKLGFTNARQRQSQFARDRVEERLEADTDRKDFMSYILRHNEGDPQGMTRAEMHMTARTFLNAGSETTATTLASCLWYLLRDPLVLGQATREVRDRFSSREEISMVAAGARNLPYLFACIEETLRMRSPIATSFPRFTDQPTLIHGDLVPPRVQVSVHQMSTHKNPNNFVDPETFAPERWLGDPRFAGDQKEAFQPFSMGPRNCLGKNLAYAELTCTLARILYSFDMTLCPESYNWGISQPSYIFWVKPELWVQFRLVGET